MNNVDIIEYEDLYLHELVNKTAKDLQKKYNKQRRINEKYLRKKKPLQKVISVFLDIFCVIILLCAFVVCFSIINTTLNGYMPNFAGYSNLVISSGSMEASGFKKGDVFIVHSVDASTLKEGDKIAFYNYPPSYANIDSSKFIQINNGNSKTKYSLTIKQLFGFQTEETKKANNAKSDIIFHHIRAVYKNENGELWFKTYGSSNSEDDTWWINEKYVVGIQDESKLAKVVVGLVDFVGKPYGMLVLVVPISILVIGLIFSFGKSVQVAKLELDCVEEKRRITDPICVKNKVGLQMDKKTKLKILAQAANEDKDEYINLLWKKGKQPENIKKYYTRKKLELNLNKELLMLNRECEKMFKEGVNANIIAKHYINQRRKLQNRVESVRTRLKSIDRHKNKKV